MDLRYVVVISLLFISSHRCVFVGLFVCLYLAKKKSNKSSYGSHVD